MEKFEVIYVRFPNVASMSTEVYAYRHTEVVKVGSWVVVDTPQKGYNLARVCPEPGAFVDVEIDDNMEAPSLRMRQPKKISPTKWIVCVVDDSAYAKRQADEARAKDIKGQLDRKLKEIEEFRKYEFLKQHDSEAAELMAELEGLKGITIPPSLPSPKSST